MIQRMLMGLVLLCACASTAPARVIEERIPLREGLVSTSVQRLTSSRWIDALSKSMGDGCRLAVEGKQLVLHIDTERWPGDVDQAKRIVRAFVLTAEPEAAADYAARIGLFLPKHVAADGRIVVMVHGLDTDRAGFARMEELLRAEGYQTAYFVYPNDQAIADSGALLSQHLAALHQDYPQLKIDLLCFSMGSLVARSYVEGDAYAGGVDHFIMLGPPNHGSSWAKFRILLEMRDHVRLFCSDAKWHPAWMVADGLGEAGRDLKQGSEFLTKLNACPRRDGVKYTIVMGNQNTLRRTTADAIDGTLEWMPSWKLTQKMQRWSHRFRDRVDTSDGPVKLDSAKLDGVNDTVVVRADHDALYLPVNGPDPASWPTIRERLGR
jgi:hypothetical protein